MVEGRCREPAVVHHLAGHMVEGAIELAGGRSDAVGLAGVRYAARRGHDRKPAGPQFPGATAQELRPVGTGERGHLGARITGQIGEPRRAG